jgi:adenylate kinase
MGVPGSGKDTQASLLESDNGFKIIRVGQLIRELSRKDKELNKIQKKGDLADEILVNELMSDALDRQPENSNILSDGYPRSLTQAKKLEEMCLNKKIKLVKVLFLHVDDKEVLKRLNLRARADDTDKTIQNRLNIFRQFTLPVIEYFDNKKLINKINGLGSVEEVHQRIIQVL